MVLEDNLSFVLRFKDQLISSHEDVKILEQQLEETEFKLQQLELECKDKEHTNRYLAGKLEALGETAERTIQGTDDAARVSDEWGWSGGWGMDLNYEIDWF